MSASCHFLLQALQCPCSVRKRRRYNSTNGYVGAIPKRPIAKTAPTKTAPKILISKNIVQNGPFRCPKRPIIQRKRPIAKSKTAHSYIQNGPLSLSAFGNVQSDLEILYMFRPVIHGLEALMILKQSNVRPCTMV